MDYSKKPTSHEKQLMGGVMRYFASRKTAYLLIFALLTALQPE